MPRAPARVLPIVLVALAAAALFSPAAALAISRTQADAIALQRLDPQHAKGDRVTVFGLRRPLKATDSLVIAGPSRLGNDAPGGLKKLGRPVWLYWEDLEVGAMFQHPSRLLLVDDATGRVTLDRVTGWYPLVDGRVAPFLGTKAAYYGPTYRVYSNVAPRAFARTSFARPPARGPLVTPLPGFEDDCLLIVGLIPSDGPNGMLGKAAAAAQEAWSGLGGQFGIPTYYATKRGPASEPPTKPADQVGDNLLRDNVGDLVEDQGCKDVLIYVLGHGEPPKGWTDPNGNVFPGKPPSIQVAEKREITAAGLKKTLERYGPDSSHPATFKLALESCFSGRFKAELADEPNLKVIATSSNGTETTQSNLSPDPNENLPEWDAGMVEGMRDILADEAEVDALRDEGDSLLARFMVAAMADITTHDRAAARGLTHPCEVHNLASPPMTIPFYDFRIGDRHGIEMSWLGVYVTGEPKTAIHVVVTSDKAGAFGGDASSAVGDVTLGEIGRPAAPQDFPAHACLSVTIYQHATYTVTATGTLNGQKLTITKTFEVGPTATPAGPGCP